MSVEYSTGVRATEHGPRPDIKRGQSIGISTIFMNQCVARTRAPRTQMHAMTRLIVSVLEKKKERFSGQAQSSGLCVEWLRNSQPPTTTASTSRGGAGRGIRRFHQLFYLSAGLGHLCRTFAMFASVRISGLKFLQKPPMELCSRMPTDSRSLVQVLNGG